MASNPAATCQANGDSKPGGVPAARRSCGHRSESESDAGPTSKSLARLCSRDDGERRAALEELSQGVLQCLDLDRHGSERLSKQTLLHLLRLSRSCPLQEVRERAVELLRTAQVNSCTIHRQASPSVRFADRINRELGEKSYSNSARAPFVTIKGLLGTPRRTAFALHHDVIRLGKGRFTSLIS